MDGITRSDRGLQHHVTEEIKVALVRRGMSARQLAERCGWRQAFISRRMTGELSWTLDEISTVASALDLDALTLFPAPVDRGISQRYPDLADRAPGHSSPGGAVSRIAHAFDPNGQGRHADLEVEPSAVRRPVVQSYQCGGVLS